MRRAAPLRGDGGHEAAVLARLRRALLAVLAIGLVGTAVDLVLLAHYEDAWQWAPLVIISVCLLSVGWHAMSPGMFSVMLMRVAMATALGGAATGVVLHYRGSMAFQLEMDPSMGRADLLMKVLTSKAPPTLAPMSLALLGLVGLASTYEDPAGGSRGPGRAARRIGGTV